ncbi:hypothetical protein GIB67_001149 [Kingdonia uniflora]|uniref:Uncharacterized protein n=1 Tax=Kingdonia uniflora TaxID=39325 RepID=A0A7J7LG26_9MAGN|nr:hypothetical protein GIB67_001149 [Kingdonia uniflora]
MCGVQGDGFSIQFRNSNEKAEEDRENDAHKIYKGLNGGNDFKHREAYKILAWEQRWANLRDDGLNHAVNIPRNVARRTSDNSSPGNSVGSNNLSKDPDGPPTPQSTGPNSDLDGSIGIHALLDKLRLDKMKRKKKRKEEEHKQCNTDKPKWIWSKQRKITKSWRKT